MVRSLLLCLIFSSEKRWNSPTNKQNCQTIDYENICKKKNQIKAMGWKTIVDTGMFWFLVEAKHRGKISLIYLGSQYARAQTLTSNISRCPMCHFINVSWCKPLKMVRTFSMVKIIGKYMAEVYYNQVINFFSFIFLSCISILYCSCILWLYALNTHVM